MTVRQHVDDVLPAMAMQPTAAPLDMKEFATVPAFKELALRNEHVKQIVPVSPPVGRGVRLGDLNIMVSGKKPPGEHLALLAGKTDDRDEEIFHYDLPGCGSVPLGA